MAIEKTDKIWHNGKLILWDEATIHVMSHVIHYGSSVFEGIRCYALPTGPAIFRAQEHIERLVNSAKVYRIDLDFTREEILKGMVETIAHNAVWPCYIRPIVLRGYGEAGVRIVLAPMVADHSFYEAIPGLIEALPPGLQKILREESAGVERYWQSATSQQLAEAVQILKKNGVTFTDVQYPVFRKAVDPVYAQFRSRIGADLLDRMMRAAG